MNANELADELDGFLKEQEQLPWGTKQVYLDQAATTLRQQQAEIKALKKLVSEMKYEKSSGVYEMNNESVAWMSKIDNHIVTFDKRLVDEAEYAGADNWMPMYLHPVKEQDTDCQYCKQGCIRCDARKQLTDEEIEELIWNTTDMKDFARAILRKASEK